MGDDVRGREKVPGKKGWLALVLLVPIALTAIGTQVAAVTGIVGIAQAASAARARDSAGLERGSATLRAAAGILDLTWSSPAARVLEYNPMTLGAIDDLRASVHAIAIASRTLNPLAVIGSLALGFDATTPMITGTTIDTTRVPALAEPAAALHDALAATREALAQVRGSGPLGRPVGAVADSLEATFADLTVLAGAAEVAIPALPGALGEQEPKRYLITALNDAELFGSGGAPLFG